MLARLHAMAPNIFPLPPVLHAPYRPPPSVAPGLIIGGERAAAGADGSLCACVSLFAPAGVYPSGPETDVSPPPTTATIDHHSMRAEELDVQAVMAEIAAAGVERRNETNAAAGTAPEVIFLGTGSAEPSKYRGSSGILVRLPFSDSGVDGGWMLLDAGEGVLGTMTRYLGPAAAAAAVAGLRAVWISHHHPDHMLGVPGVLAARPKHAPPLALVGPKALQEWIRRAPLPPVAARRPHRFVHSRGLFAGGGGNGGPFRLPQCPPPRYNAQVTHPHRWQPHHVPFQQLPFACPPPSYHVGPFQQHLHMQTPMGASMYPLPPPPAPPPAFHHPPTYTHVPSTLPPFPNSLAAELGLCRFEAVPVQHCPEAAALILGHASGWSLAYSGDCRPSRQFSAAARGVQVMIHEATFEDDLADHAVSKRHCTTGEALRVAGEASAGCTILTHFSQRYPKATAAMRSAAVEDTDGINAVATGGEDSNQTGTVAPLNSASTSQAQIESVITAFDGMRVRWDRLGDLPGAMERIIAMFVAYEELKDGEQREAS